MPEAGGEGTLRLDPEGQVVRSILAAAKRFPRFEFNEHRDWLLWHLADLAKNGRKERHRLRATESLLRLNPEFAQPALSGDHPTVINVAIFSSDATRLPSQANGGAIRVVSSQGDGPRDHGVGSEGRRQYVGGALGDGDARQ